MNKVPFTWLEYANSMHCLHHRLIANKVEIDCIMGISRGGVPPAKYLAEISGKELVIIDPNYVQTQKTGNILLVDEISDSGATFARVVGALSKTSGINITTVSIHCRHSSYYVPNYYDIRILNDDWIVYPWEKGE